MSGAIAGPLKRMLLLLTFVCYFLLFAGAEAIARKAEPVYSYRPISSSNLYHSKKNSRMLYLQAQMAAINGAVEKAVKLARQAVELDPEDVDARVVYGEALYKKYLENKEDHSTYNECVKTWLVVHRNVVGDESAAQYKGIGIPLANKFFEDENHNIVAKKRLISLCGRLPKFWETNQKFLKKVLTPETRVAGEVVEGEKLKKREGESDLH